MKYSVFLIIIAFTTRISYRWSKFAYDICKLKLTYNTMKVLRVHNYNFSLDTYIKWLFIKCDRIAKNINVLSFENHFVVFMKEILSPTLPIVSWYYYYMLQVCQHAYTFPLIRTTIFVPRNTLQGYFNIIKGGERRMLGDNGSGQSWVSVTVRTVSNPWTLVKTALTLYKWLMIVIIW